MYSVCYDSLLPDWVDSTVVTVGALGGVVAVSSTVVLSVGVTLGVENRTDGVEAYSGVIVRELVVCALVVIDDSVSVVDSVVGTETYHKGNLAMSSEFNHY